MRWRRPSPRQMDGNSSGFGCRGSWPKASLAHVPGHSAPCGSLPKRSTTSRHPTIDPTNIAVLTWPAAVSSHPRSATSIGSLKYMCSHPESRLGGDVLRALRVAHRSVRRMHGAYGRPPTRDSVPAETGQSRCTWWPDAVELGPRCRSGVRPEAPPTRWLPTTKSSCHPRALSDDDGGIAPFGLGLRRRGRRRLPHPALGAGVAGGSASCWSWPSRPQTSLLDLHRPLWELYVVEGLKPCEFAMYSKRITR